MKGTFTGVLIMIALLILSFTMAVTTLFSSQAFAEEMTKSYTDLSKLSTAKTYGDMRHHNEGLPAAEYSINNQTIKLAKQGGGYIWTKNNIPTQKQIAQRLETKANQHIYDTYAGTDSLVFCESPKINHTLETKPTQENKVRINVSTHKGKKQKKKPAEFICTFQDTVINYTAKKPKYGNNFRETRTATKYTAEGNKYYILTKISIDLFNKIENKLDNVGPSSAQSRSCGNYPSKSSVESSAVSSLETKVNNDISSSKPNPSTFKIKKLDTDISGTFTYGTTSNVLDGSSSSRRWTGNCCSSCGPDSSDTDWHYTNVTSSPGKTKIDWIIEDERRILTGKGFQNLTGRVEPYTYDW